VRYSTSPTCLLPRTNSGPVEGGPARHVRECNRPRHVSNLRTNLEFPHSTNRQNGLAPVCGRLLVRGDVVHLRLAADVEGTLLRRHVPACDQGSPLLGKFVSATPHAISRQRAAGARGCANSSPAVSPHPMMRESRRVDTRAPRPLDHSTLHATMSPALSHTSSCAQQPTLFSSVHMHQCSMIIAHVAITG
jgi:hypothetical protein